MTKEQFLNGDLFRFNVYGASYRLSDEKNSINTAFVASDGRVLDMAFETHVDFMGTVNVKMSRMVMNRTISQTIPYEKMVLIDIEEEVKTKLYLEEKRREREEEKENVVSSHACVRVYGA